MVHYVKQLPIKYWGIAQKNAAWEVRQGLEDYAGSWKDYKGDDSKTQIEAQRCNMWGVERKLEGQWHFWWAGTSDTWKEKFHI